MLLLRELAESVSFITEKTEDGIKTYFIEGPFMQGAIKNNNGRIYPVQVLENEINRYIEQRVKQNRAWGELGHPDKPSINLDRSAIMVKKIYKEGNDFIGKAKVLTELPMGKIVKGLLDEGGKLGVSSRGLGSLKEVNGVNEVQDDFRLIAAADVVADPSAPDAFVRGIFENVEWIYDNVNERYIERVMEPIKKMSLREVERKKLAFFEHFLREVGRNG